MKPISVKTVISILESNGFVFLRQKKGSHRVYGNALIKATAVVPLHGRNQTLPIGTFLSIVKQSKIPKEKFK